MIVLLEQTHPICHGKLLTLALFLANMNFRYMLSPVRPSVCRLSVCLSSVMFVHPTQAVQIFRNISMALGTVAIH